MSATERIRHYNRLLVWQHKFVGGTVLRGYGLNTRTFEWDEGNTFRTWGADYQPDMLGTSWLSRLLVGPDYDPELGTPGTAMAESWLSIASKLGKRATRVTRYEYGTGAMRGITPYIQIAEYELNVPFKDVTGEHIQGGLGYWRPGLIEFPHKTEDPQDAENLAQALQSAAVHAVGLSGQP